MESNEWGALQDRIPFLDTGIVEILAKATGGIGIVLEHRYYGARYTPIFSYCGSTLPRQVNSSTKPFDRQFEVRPVSLLLHLVDVDVNAKDG